MTHAVGLYEKLGYTRIKNYSPHNAMYETAYFEKMLDQYGETT